MRGKQRNRRAGCAVDEEGKFEGQVDVADGRAGAGLCRKARTRGLGEFGGLLTELDIVKFCWQHKFGLICSLISLDLAAIGHLPTVYILVATTSPLLCLVFSWTGDPRAR